MKKRIVAFLLCMTMAVGVTACGESKNESTQETTEAAATFTYDGARSAQMDIDLEKQVKSLSDYNGIDLTITGNYEVTDENVENTTMQLLSYMGAGNVEVTDRDVVEAGDYVKIDYVGYKDDVAFEGGTATDVIMDPVNNMDVTSQSGYIDGFCDDIIGAKVGDVLHTDVTFPEQYQSAELAGQPAVFEITIKGIYQPVTIDTLTDDAVETAFGAKDLHTKDELLEYVRSMLASQVETYKSQATISAAQSYILEHSDVEIPEEYMQARMDELEYSTTIDNCTEGQTLEAFLVANGTTLEAERESWKTSLTQQIQIEFLFGRIADLENIEVDEEEFTQFIDYIIQSDNGSFADANAVYEYYGIGNAQDGEQALRQLYRVNKAVSFVVDNANVIVDNSSEDASAE